MSNSIVLEMKYNKETPVGGNEVRYIRRAFISIQRCHFPYLLRYPTF